MVFEPPSSWPGEWDTYTPLGFWPTNGSPNPCQTNRPYNNQQKKRTCKIEDFCIPADHRLKLKENLKKDKYLDLARELKKTMEYESGNNIKCDWWFLYSHQRIIKVSGGLGYKRTSEDHRNYYIIENGHYWEVSWRLEETCCHSNSRERSSAYADLKDSQGVNNNNNDNFDSYFPSSSFLIPTPCYFLQTLIARVFYCKGIFKDLFNGCKTLVESHCCQYLI